MNKWQKASFKCPVCKEKIHYNDIVERPYGFDYYFEHENFDTDCELAEVRFSVIGEKNDKASDESRKDSEESPDGQGVRGGGGDAINKPSPDGNERRTDPEERLSKTT